MLIGSKENMSAAFDPMPDTIPMGIDGSVHVNMDNNDPARTAYHEDVAPQITPGQPLECC